MLLSGKTVLVTGATSGIGKETAARLSEMGAKVLLHARDGEKGRKTVEEILARYGGGKIQLLLADLSSIAGAKSLAEQVKKETDRLDVLINNAGGYFSARRESPDGFEWTFALNVIAPFVLSQALLPLLEKSGAGRVVNVGSEAQIMGRILWDDPMQTKGYSGMLAYSQAKLALVMLTMTMAEKIRPRGITANVLHPGLVKTSFMSNSTGVFYFLGSLFARLFGWPVGKGAETSLYLAASDEVKGITGKYFHLRKEIRRNPLSDDAAGRERLWKALETYSGAQY